VFELILDHYEEDEFALPSFISYITYYPSVDLYRITKSMDMKIVTFLGLKR
jgi:hypothetical protein